MNSNNLLNLSPELRARVCTHYDNPEHKQFKKIQFNPPELVERVEIATVTKPKEKKD